jgi:hypothetical protein
MYLLNPATIPKDRLYTCNGIVAKFLIYKANIPLLSRSGRIWYFSRTTALEKALEEYQDLAKKDLISKRERR